jgi:predicted amidohydrolase
MRIATVQFEPQFGRVDDNIARAIALISNIKADLFVLPELCFSGYTFKSQDEAESLAEPAVKGKSIDRMRELSSRIRAAIVFGFPEKAERGLFNSCAFVPPDGDPVIYRKLHLFLDEKEFFLPGDLGAIIADYRGVKLGLMICFDWIFPEMARTLALSGAHILCHPANLVMPHCQGAMVTRCLENRVFAVTANRIGREFRGGFDNKFTGRSQITSTKGQVLFRGSEDKEEVGVADIDFVESENKAVNARNNLWADRRPEFYKKYGEEKL